ncbi:CoA-transferase [Kaistia algarum]|uniref:CoA-transferase n=1 Tax=Kaistia algarum TaxID=2083279 RepID=UPI000CE89D1E|nr:CoA-transferase [Kaistia algarum]MCX5514356.1 CoA-transferase [Kaistia algarum]PPE79106.1 CoA-transferase [Kaistia algarum]
MTRHNLTKSNSPAFVDLPTLAGMVEDGDRFGVGGHHFARLPIALLRSIAALHKTNLTYTSWAGGLALEMLLEAGCVGSIDLCFSSLDIFGLPPRFRAVAEAGEIPVRDWTALAMIEALRAAQQNLPAGLFQLPLGSAMMEKVPGARAVDDPIAGEPIGAIPPLVLDTVVLHAPRADASGNVQIIGARALDLAMVGAARRVLVTVDEIVPVGGLAAAGRQTVLTRNQISAIALVPGGAWPTSCLPFYATDYAALAAAFADEAPLADCLALPETGLPPHLKRAVRIRAAKLPERFPAIHATPEVPTIDEILVVRLAAELDDESFASAGAVSPLANVAYRLAKATHAPGMMLATLSCGHIDIEPSPMLLSALESLDAETAAGHAGGDDTYSTYYQAGSVTHEIIGAAQIDRFGRVNNLAITKKSGGMLRLPGQGGMADVANMHRDYALYVTRHSRLSLVERVDFASSGRGLLGAAERSLAGYRTGRAQIFTDLCVFRLDEATGELVVAEIMPGASREAIVAATGFEPRFAADCREVPLPDRDGLDILRHRIDPLGLRRLEFVSARDRGGLIAEILAADRSLIDQLGGTTS